MKLCAGVEECSPWEKKCFKSSFGRKSHQTVAIEMEIMAFLFPFSIGTRS